MEQTLSPDGKTLVTIGVDATARLWDSRTAKPLAILRKDDERVVHCGFSPDGKIIFTSDYDSILRFWNNSDGTFRAKTRAPANRWEYPKDVTFKKASEVAYKANGVWITDNRVLTQSLPVRFYGIGDWIADGPSHPAELWDTATGRAIARFDRPENKGGTYRFKNDGKWIVTIEDKRRVIIFSAENGREIARLEHDKRNVKDVFVCPTERRVATVLVPDNQPSYLQVWNTASWRVEPWLITGLHGISSPNFLADDLIKFDSYELGNYEWCIYRYGQAEPIMGSVASVEPDAVRLTNELALVDGRLFDLKNWQRLLPRNC